MVQLRHILHPVRSAKSLYGKLRLALVMPFAKQQFREIPRGRRDRCWCGGKLLPFKWHPSYGECSNCGCYVNQRPPLPEALKRLYAFDLYWHSRQHLKGFPTIEGRSANDRSDGRVDYWLELIERYAPSSSTVVEVGCAHGVLLVELTNRGHDCIGVEPDKRTTDWVRKNTGVDVRPGFFPYIDLPNRDLFLAFDVIEHSPNPEAFMKGIAQLLNPGGIAIIQTPIPNREHEPPFGKMFDLTFDDLEHLWIFTAISIRQLGEAWGLKQIGSEQWTIGHEVVVFQKSA